MEEINSALYNAFIFNNIDENTMLRISHRAYKSAYTKGKVMFFHGDRAEYYYFIYSGHVKLFRETPDGTQAVIDVLPKGSLFGECAIFENNLYPYTAEIVEQSEIVSLPLNDLRYEIENNNSIAINMLRSMSKHRRKQELELEHRLMLNAPQRIACHLLQLSLTNKASPNTITLPYDKMLLASRIGMQPETFSRALSKLKKDTGLSVKGLTVYIDDINLLSTYCCPSCSRKFPCGD